MWPAEPGITGFRHDFPVAADAFYTPLAMILGVGFPSSCWSPPRTEAAASRCAWIILWVRFAQVRGGAPVVTFVVSFVFRDQRVPVARYLPNSCPMSA